MKEHENKWGVLFSLSEAIVYGESPLERHSLNQSSERWWITTPGKTRHYVIFFKISSARGSLLLLHNWIKKVISPDQNKISDKILRNIKCGCQWEYNALCRDIKRVDRKTLIHFSHDENKKLQILWENGSSIIHMLILRHLPQICIMGCNSLNEAFC